MRTSRVAASLACFAVAAASAISGCATAMPEVRTADAPNVRTVTSIGDRPISVASGDPGSQEASIIPRALADREPEREVAGRVVDTRGRPVPNAEVRVAIGNTTGGRHERVFTDELGRFTLHDLREGSDYSIVAEWPDGRGSYMTGRSQAVVPAREVEITLAPPGATAEAAQVGRVSQREELLDDDEPSLGEPAYAGRSAGRINDEDLPLPAEAETLLTEQGGGRLAEESYESEIAWKRRDGMGGAAAAAAGAGASAAAFGASLSGSSAEMLVGDPEPFDENNPLPPAREQPIGFKPPLSRQMGSEPEMQPVAPASSTNAGFDGQEDSSRLQGLPEPMRPADPASEHLIEKTFAGSPEPNFPTIEAGKTATASPAPVAAPTTSPAPLSSGPEPEPTPAVEQQPEMREESETPVLPFASEPPPAAPPAASEAVMPVEPSTEPGPDNAAPELPAPGSETGIEPPSFPLEGFGGDQSGPAEPTPPASTPPAPPPGPGEGLEEAPAGLGPPTLEEAGPPPGTGEPAGETPQASAAARKWSWSELAQATGTATSNPLAVASATSSSRVVPAVATAAAAGTRSGGGPPSLVASEGTPALVASERTIVDPQLVPASCEFDKKGRRIVDFQMTDVNGKMFRFSELDTEYILLDFWGTWCGPCVRSIPHLVDLQSRFGADKLKIVGVAYEEGGFQERVTTVKSVARRLGINYDVLIGEADGQPCPLREALNIEVFPTMVLLDRQGRIVWRDQGATASTMGRLDRIIAVNLSGQTVRR